MRRGGSFCSTAIARAADIIFREQLEDLKDRYLARLSVFHVLSREQQDIAMLNGHLDAAKVGVLLRSVVPAATVDQAFVCGPQPMIEGLEKALTDLGMPSRAGACRAVHAWCRRPATSRLSCRHMPRRRRSPR